MILVIYPLISLIEDQVKEGQPIDLTCASLQDFHEDPQRQIFKGSPTSSIDSRRRITHCGDLDGKNGRWKLELSLLA